MKHKLPVKLEKKLTIRRIKSESYQLKITIRKAKRTFQMVILGCFFCCYGINTVSTT